MALMGLGEREPCVITNEPWAFNGWVTVVWESCPDHYYLVEGKIERTDLHREPLAVVRGEDTWTSWTDEHAAAFPHRYYRVTRLNAANDQDSDGLADAAELVGYRSEESR